MRIVQSVCGVFHQFEIAGELNRHDCLERIHSNLPWSRLKREGLPRDKVSIEMASELVALSQLALRRTGLRTPASLNRALSDLAGTLFDRGVAARAVPADAFLAISGCSLRAGRAFQRAGSLYICDRGSSHIAFQRETVREELALWRGTGDFPTPANVAHDEEEYATADAIAVPSTFSLRTFVSHGVPREKLLLLPYGVRLDRFYPEGEPAPDSFDVLFAGQVSFRKGIPYLLEALRLLDHPNKRLRIAGAVQPGIRDYLAANTPPGVELLGSVPQPELRRLMSTSRCLVLPSVEDGFGLVIGQAMACGCPVIASTNTGGEDLIEDGKEGFIVPVRDARALADKLQWMADNSLSATAMRTAARARVAGLGGWSDYADRLLTEIRTLKAR